MQKLPERLGSGAGQKELRELLLQALTRCGRKTFTHAKLERIGTSFVVWYFTEKVEGANPLRNRRSSLAISKALVEIGHLLNPPDAPWTVFYGTVHESQAVIARRPWSAAKKKKQRLRKAS